MAALLAGCRLFYREPASGDGKILRPGGDGECEDATTRNYFFFGDEAGEDWLRLSISFCFACELALSLLDF